MATPSSIPFQQMNDELPNLQERRQRTVNALVLLNLGNYQIIIGILSIISGGLVLTEPNFFFGIIGSGFWAGLVIIISGAFSLKASNNRWVSTALFFNIFALLTGLSAFGISLTGAIITFNCNKYWDCKDEMVNCDCGLKISSKVTTVFSTLLMTIEIVAACFLIYLTRHGWTRCCCQGSVYITAEPTPMYQQTTTTQQPQQCNPTSNQINVQQQSSLIVHLKLTRDLGIAQVIIGALCFFIGIIMLILTTDLLVSFVAVGLWGGLFTAVTGIVTICASHNRTNFCNKIAALILNIVAALKSFSGSVLSYVSIQIIKDCRYYVYPDVSYDYCFDGLIQILCVVMALLMSGEFIISILSAILTGCGCRCNDTTVYGTQQLTYVIPPHQQQNVHPAYYQPSYQRHPQQQQQQQQQQSRQLSLNQQKEPPTSSYQPSYQHHAEPTNQQHSTTQPSSTVTTATTPTFSG